MARFLALIMALVAVSGCELGLSDLDVTQLKQTYAAEDTGSQFISLEQATLHYRDQGQGPTIVLLHGIFASLHTWDVWADSLSQDYRVIRLDLPGFGLTGPASNNDYSIKAYLSHLHQLLKQLDTGPVHLVGSSLGGMIAWNYTATYPQQVSSLTLLDPAGYPFDLPWILDVAQWPIVGDMFEYITPRFVVSMNVRSVYSDNDKITPETLDRYYQLLLHPGNRQAVVQGLRDFSHSHQSIDPSAILQQIQQPALIMWGVDDAWIPFELAHRFNQDLPNSQLRLYPGVGHIPMGEIPERSLSDFRRFLTQLPTSPESEL